ncbi:MAG: hypothetical protein ACKVQJ_06175 [Pyrinomonadaceae bacterium]
MNQIIRTLLLALFITGIGITTASAQLKHAPGYKISNVSMVPFDESTGKFEEPLGESNSRYFFNDLATSLLVTFDIAGEKGSFEPGRMINVTVKEGKKIKLTRNTQVGLMNDEGHYYVPVFIYGSVCQNLTITARLSGQKTLSSVKRTVQFVCGE